MTLLSEQQIIRTHKEWASKDLKDPAYCGGFFTTVMQDDKENDFTVLITYNYYDYEDFYAGFIKRIVEYRFEALSHFEMKPVSFNDSVREAIRFHAGPGVVFEVQQMKNSN
jgi:hypothetical protein